ncbi:hypothetical protein COL922a_012483 [Colletotrichum nupharicola]|nr:hypothetical protein COL922a_012483 [Colletotrichum nupharicola]
MGAAISKFIESVENQDEKKKTANDALNSLKNLCDVKAHSFYEEIVSDTASAGSKLLPVDKVTAKDFQTYCNFSKDAEKTGEEINNAIGNFVKGEIMKDLTTTINSAINKLIGAVSGNLSERRGYAIAVGQLGGVFNLAELNRNTLNVVLQQGYSAKEGESDDNFNKRLETIKQQVVEEMDKDDLRVEVLKKRVSSAV